MRNEDTILVPSKECTLQPDFAAAYKVRIKRLFV